MGKVEDGEERGLEERWGEGKVLVGSLFGKGGSRRSYCNERWGYYGWRR